MSQWNSIKWIFQWKRSFFHVRDSWWCQVGKSEIYLVASTSHFLLEDTFFLILLLNIRELVISFICVSWTLLNMVVFSQKFIQDKSSSRENLSKHRVILVQGKVSCNFVRVCQSQILIYLKLGKVSYSVVRVRYSQILIYFNIVVYDIYVIGLSWSFDINKNILSLFEAFVSLGVSIKIRSDLIVWHEPPCVPLFLLFCLYML